MECKKQYRGIPHTLYPVSSLVIPCKTIEQFYNQYIDIDIMKMQTFLLPHIIYSHIYFTPAPHFFIIISFILLALDLFCSFFLISCDESLGYWFATSCFLIYAFSAINIPLSTALVMSHNFFCVVFSLSFSSVCLKNLLWGLLYDPLII